MDNNQNTKVENNETLYAYQFIATDGLLVTIYATDYKSAVEKMRA